MKTELCKDCLAKVRKANAEYIRGYRARRAMAVRPLTYRDEKGQCQHKRKVCTLCKLTEK